MNTTHINYQEYLESYAWKALKKTKLEEQPQCECCGAPATSVHHLSYERLGREKPEDIVSICERCHEECHHVGGYQIKNDDETLRRRFEEVKNIYGGESESGNIELKELFKHKFSQEKISTFIHSYSGQGIINGKNYATLQLLSGGEENSITTDSPKGIDKLGLVWLNPFFKIDGLLYFAYKINYWNNDNYSSIPEKELDRYYLLKLSCFDFDSFEVVSGFVVKDKRDVYLVKFLREFNGDGALELRIYKTSISSKLFTIIGGPYYKDGGDIYCEIGNNFVDCFPENILKVIGADLETFETLEGGHARDKNYIYDNGRIIEQVIQEEDDDNSYYIGDKGGCSYGEYGEDCKTLFSDRSDWCSYCKGE